MVGFSILQVALGCSNAGGLFDEIGETGAQNKKWVFSSNTRHNYFPC
jgi:hypothetical protein